MRTFFFSIAASIFLAGSAVGQQFSGSISPPSIDRWFYPFNSSPGTEANAPIFAALRQPGFDDRDAQFLLGFDTSLSIPTGAGDTRYRILSARIHVWVSNDQRFAYDPTYDSAATSYDPADPDYVADSDIDKPLELFGVGYRNGVTASSITEATAFSTTPTIPPQEGIRSAFAAIFDEAGNATDISRQVRQKFEAVPMAVAHTNTLAPGALVPQGTEFTFDIDLSNPATRNYLSRSLNAGKLMLMVTSLQPASGGPGGGTGVVYPSFYTKENALSPVLGFSPRLEISAEVYPGADFNLDGDTGTDSDIQAFFACLGGTPMPIGDSDFNMDGDYGTDADIQAFFACLGGSGC